MKYQKSTSLGPVAILVLLIELTERSIHRRRGGGVKGEREGEGERDKRRRLSIVSRIRHYLDVGFHSGIDNKNTIQTNKNTLKTIISITVTMYTSSERGYPPTPTL